MQTTWNIPFKQGLSQDNAKKIAKLVREELPKVKPQIQGDVVRVTSNSKDDLQKAITLTEQADLDIPLQFVNFR
jgi:hypothetical protein